MIKQEKLDWIVNYISEHGWQDVYMEDFVFAYIDSCEPKNYQPTLWGGYKVPELNRYLNELYKEGILDRFTEGLNFQCDGFPKWCYAYKRRN